MKSIYHIQKRQRLLFFFTRRIIIFYLFFFTSVISSYAQFLDQMSNPQVAVTLTHPPGLGLKISKVAFNTASGNCSDQIISGLIGDFVKYNIEVIDRENLQTILAEHDLTFSGYVDQNKAVAIGKIIGPSALITVKVLRCATEIKDDLYANEKMHNYQTNTDYVVKAFIARTKVFLKVSVQTADLTTGRIFAAQVFEKTSTKENKSYDGKPEAPSEFDVQEEAFRYILYDIIRMFVPWSENVTLYYFDDKDGGLKQAFQALKAGNMKSAYDLSQQNLDNCKKNPAIKEKILAHSYYNMGMSYFINNEYDKAIENFQEAQKIRPGKITTDAIAECQRGKELSTIMQKVDDKATMEADKGLAAEANAVKAENANTLTNADIIDLTNKKLPNNLILQKIKNTKCKFDTSTDALIVLTNAGVSEDVIMLMMEKK